MALIGEHELVFHEMYYKLKFEQKLPILCTLATNVLTTWELLPSGKITKIFSPLKLFELIGSVNDSKLLQINGQITYKLKNHSHIICWIQGA